MHPTNPLKPFRHQKPIWFQYKDRGLQNIAESID